MSLFDRGFLFEICGTFKLRPFSRGLIRTEVEGDKEVEIATIGPGKSQVV